MGVAVGPGLRDGLRAAAAGGHRRAARPRVQLAQQPGAAVRADVDDRRAAAGRAARRALGPVARRVADGRRRARRAARRAPRPLVGGADHHRRRACWPCTRCGPGSGRRPSGRRGIRRSPARRAPVSGSARWAREHRTARPGRPRFIAFEGGEGWASRPRPAGLADRARRRADPRARRHRGGRPAPGAAARPGDDRAAPARRGAADGGRPGAARAPGRRPGAGHRAPRGHRPVRRIVDRLPGLRPRSGPRRGAAAVGVGLPMACGPTWSSCSTSRPPWPRPAWGPSPTASSARAATSTSGWPRASAALAGGRSGALGGRRRVGLGERVADAVPRSVADRLQLDL